MLIEKKEQDDEAVSHETAYPFSGPPVVEYAPRVPRLRTLASNPNANQAMSQASPPRGTGQFQIQFEFVTPGMPQAQKNSFIYAANRLGKMITTKHSPLALQDSTLRCPALPNKVLPSSIQDLFIFVEVSAIDGESGTLGQAGPCILDGNGFPRIGFVQFDSEDVARMITAKTFDAVCLHEISHILGFGTLWPIKSLVQNSGSSNPRYNGRYGIAGMKAIYPSNQFGTVPVQNTGGSGTADSHWRDTVFGVEMMTAYLDQPYQPISQMSVESFRDLGYTVDSSAFDDFNGTDAGSSGIPPNYVPPKETPSTWTTFSNGTWNSTTIWIVVCVAVVVLIFLLSFCYSRRRNRLPPPPPPALPPLQQQQQALDDNIPLAFAVPVSDSADIQAFMEVTQCQDTQVAIAFLHKANNNVSQAVEDYLTERHLTAV